MWSDDTPQPPLELEPFLVVQLKPGWRHDAESGTFRQVGEDHDDGEVFDPSPDLGEEARIEPMIPDLARSAPACFSEWESALARYLHLFPGADTDLDRLLETVQGWVCVYKAHLPPRISLP